MNTPVVFQNLVDAAAESLVAQGVKPTLATVHAELGLKGSRTTVLKYLNVWESTRKPMVVDAPSLPVEIQRVLLSVITQQVSLAKAELGERLVEAQARAAAVASDAEGLEISLKTRDAELAVCTATNQVYEGRVSQLDLDLLAMGDLANRERLHAEAARVALARAELRLESFPTLQTEILELRASLENARKACASFEAQAAVSSERAAGSEARLTDFQVREKQLQQEMAQRELKLQDQLQSVMKEHATLLNIIETVRARAAVVEGELKAAIVGLDAERARAAEYKRQLLRQ